MTSRTTQQRWEKDILIDSESEPAAAPVRAAHIAGGEGDDYVAPTVPDVRDWHAFVSGGTVYVESSTIAHELRHFDDAMLSVTGNMVVSEKHVLAKYIASRLNAPAIQELTPAHIVALTGLLDEVERDAAIPVGAGRARNEALNAARNAARVRADALRIVLGRKEKNA